MFSQHDTAVLLDNLIEVVMISLHHPFADMAIIQTSAARQEQEQASQASHLHCRSCSSGCGDSISGGTTLLLPEKTKAR
jgi:hypothetical protein